MEWYKEQISFQNSNFEYIGDMLTWDLLKYSFLLSFPMLAMPLLSCNKEVPTSPNPVQTVILRTGTPVVLSESNMELTLTLVTDDVRCQPGDGSCDWPGAAEVEVRVVQSQSDTSYIWLAIGGSFPLDDSKFL